MNNKGFSLVELIISVAILTIITSAVLGFIITGTKSYGNVSEDVDLQQELQLSLNQIGDIIIDSTNGIKYYYNNDESKTILSDADIVGDPSTKTLAIYNTVKEEVSGLLVERKYIYNIIWNKANKELQFRKDLIDDSTGAVTQGSPELMAEFVTAFSPSLVNVDKKRKVSINISFERDNKTLEASKNYALRNKTVVNGQLSDMYSDINGSISAVTDVKITHDNVEASEVTLWKNVGSVSFGHKVAGIGFPSNDVTWALSGSTSSVASEESGSIVTPTATGCTVTIGANEASGSLSLVATSKMPGTDGSAVSSQPVVINFKEITGISLNVTGDTSGEYFPGDTFTVTANVVGTGSLTEEDKKINWNISGVQRTSDYPEASMTQKFKVIANIGEKVNVSATAINNNSCTNAIPEITVKGYELKPTADNNALLWKGDSKNHEPASSLYVRLELVPNPQVKQDVIWSIDKSEYWDDNYHGWVNTDKLGVRLDQMNSDSVKVIYTGNSFWLDRRVTISVHLKNHPETSASIYVYTSSNH